MRPGKVSEMTRQTLAPPDEHAGCWWRASRAHTHCTEFTQVKEFKDLCTTATAINCIRVLKVHVGKGLNSLRRLDCTKCIQALDNSNNSSSLHSPTPAPRLQCRFVEVNVVIVLFETHTDRFWAKPQTGATLSSSKCGLNFVSIMTLGTPAGVCIQLLVCKCYVEISSQ